MTEPSELLQKQTSKQNMRGLSGVAKSWLFNSEGGKFSVHKLARLAMLDFSKRSPK